ncbi:MAG: alanine racemase [Alphaproteobacteria bacterium]|nr:alanine racemase [Alphaproteobacteria bacterium]
MTMERRAGVTLTVDLDALAANYRALRSAAPGADCAAVVKANAYGLGASEVSARLYAEGCRRFFVVTVEEGLDLRQLFENAAPGQVPEIYVLAGPSATTTEDFVAGWLTPVLCTWDQLALWDTFAASVGRPLGAALHVDTGMNRLGISIAEASRLLDWVKTHPAVPITLVMSHLACAEEPTHPKNAEQLHLFGAIRRQLPLAKASLANSAGIHLGSAYHFEIVRPGIALYGGNPLLSKVNKFRQVVTIKSKIVQIREIDTPQTVGYGATHKATRSSRIATVPMGYADGYLRSLSNSGFAAVAGIRVRVVGRVSMDFLTLDVTEVPAVGPGTEVELLGGQVDIDALAAAGRSISYELLTRLGPRLHRVYRGSVL